METSFIVVAFMVWLACLAGWVNNIVQLVTSDVVGGFELLRAVGVLVAPIGIILGWFF